MTYADESSARIYSESVRGLGLENEHGPNNGDLPYTNVISYANSRK